MWFVCACTLKNMMRSSFLIVFKHATSISSGKTKTSNYMYKSQNGNLTIRFYTALAFSCGAREKRKDINNCPFYYWYLLKSKTLHLCQSCMCWKWFRTSTSCSVHWFSWFSPSFWWPGHRHVCHIPPDSCFWWRSVLIQNWIKA